MENVKTQQIVITRGMILQDHVYGGRIIAHFIMCITSLCSCCTVLFLVTYLTFSSYIRHNISVKMFILAVNTTLSCILDPRE